MTGLILDLMCAAGVNVVLASPYSPKLPPGRYPYSGPPKLKL